MSGDRRIPDAIQEAHDNAVNQWMTKFRLGGGPPGGSIEVVTTIVPLPEIEVEVLATFVTIKYADGMSETESFYTQLPK